MNPLDLLILLEEKIGAVLGSEGVTIQPDSLKVQPSGFITFRVNILPETIITDEDFDQDRYDKVFEDMIGEW